MRSREIKERRIQHGIQKLLQCFRRASRKMPVVVREFKGSKVTIAQPSVRDVQLRSAFNHLSAHAVVALCSGRFLVILESTSPELVVAPDHKEHFICVSAQESSHCLTTGPLLLKLLLAIRTTAIFSCDPAGARHSCRAMLRPR